VSNVKNIPKALVVIAIILTMFIGVIGFSYSGLNQSRADNEPRITGVFYYRQEAIEVGALVEFSARATWSDGSETYESIIYTRLDVRRINTIFDTVPVEGFVRGFEQYTISQTILVLPPNPEFLISLGTNVIAGHTHNEMSDTWMLDHTGVTSLTCNYHQAVLRRFPNIRNRHAAKQFGINIGANGDYGYTGTHFVGGPAFVGQNIFRTVSINMWRQQTVEVQAVLPSGNYDVHIGVFNHWGPRTVSASLNNEVVDSNFNILNQHLLSFRNISPMADGRIAFSMTGRANFAEPMISFMAVSQPNPPVEPSLPEIVEYEDGEWISLEIMELGEYRISIANLQDGAKLQIFNGDNYNLITEQIVGFDSQSENNNGIFTMTFEPQMLDGVFQLGFTQILPGGQSQSAQLSRTDIEDFEVMLESLAYRGDPLPVTVSGRSVSTITGVIAYLNGNVYYERVNFENPSQVMTYTLDIAHNGIFDIILFSGRASIRRRINVDFIDLNPPVLTVGLSLESARLSAPDRIAVDIGINTIAPVTSLGYIADGNTNSLNADTRGMIFNDSGMRVLFMNNVIGRRDTVSVNIALDETRLRTVSLERYDTSPRSTRITFNNANGFEFGSAMVFFQSESGHAERVIGVNNNEFTVFQNGTYFAQITSADGTIEIAVIAVNNFNPENPSGFPAGRAALITLAITLPLAILVIVVVAIILFKKKKAEGVK